LNVILTDLKHNAAQESTCCKNNKDEIHNMTGKAIECVEQIITGTEIIEGYSGIRIRANGEWSLAV
jgi:hypothetical protein